MMTRKQFEHTVRNHCDVPLQQRLIDHEEFLQQRIRQLQSELDFYKRRRNVDVTERVK